MLLERVNVGVFVGREAAEVELTVGADEALAEAHTQTQEEDGCHTAHREEDDHGRSHCSTQTHNLTSRPVYALK